MRFVTARALVVPLEQRRSRGYPRHTRLLPVALDTARFAAVLAVNLVAVATRRGTFDFPAAVP